MQVGLPSPPRGMLVSMKFAPREGLFLPENHALRELIAAHAFLNTLAVMAFMVLFAMASLRKAEIGLQAQYARSSALMNTVFPPLIVSRLISGKEDRIADRIEGLTVLFADVVGFTKAAHDLPPEEIIGYLDGMVRCFDRLCAENGVEKIKTIGDRYMAVGGLTGDFARSSRRDCEARPGDPAIPSRSSCTRRQAPRVTDRVAYRQRHSRHHR